MAGTEDTPRGFIPGVGTPAYEPEHGHSPMIDLDEGTYLTGESISDEAEDDEEAGDRNPEPPPELVHNVELLAADTIGDTVFSKHWLFSTLMRLIQAVDSEDQGKEGPVTDQGVDLDENLQDELCKLWDMSMNAEVVSFLQEFKAVNILTGVISKSKAPRATEICVGILGNMACNDIACKEISCSSKLIDLILLLLEDPDAPTLVEATRLLHVCLSNSSHRSPWLHAVKRDESVFNSVKFILQSSTNNDLLSHTANLVDKLFDVAEDICVSWSSSEFTLALLEAAKQIGSRPSDTLDLYLHVFQLISTSQQGVQALLPHAGDLGGLMIEYLRHICADDVMVLEDHGNSLASTFSVLNVIFASWDQRMVFYLDDFQIIRCLLKVLTVLFPKIHPDIVSNYNRHKFHRSKSRKDSGSQLSPLRHSICEGTGVALVSQSSSGDDVNIESCKERTENTNISNSGSREDAVKLDIDMESVKGQNALQLGSGEGIVNLENGNSKAKTEDKNASQSGTGEGVVKLETSKDKDKTEEKNVSQSGTGEGDVKRNSEKEKTDLDGSHAGNSSQTDTDNKERAQTNKDIMTMMRMLYEVIQGFLVDIVAASSVHIQSLVENQENEENKEGNNNTDCQTPDTLEYLDSCQRDRLHYMIWTLKETETSLPGSTQSHPAQDLLDSSIHFNLHRLGRIIRDSLDT